MLDVDPYPPSQYGWPWLVLGIGLLLVIVAWYVLLPFIVRGVTREPAAPPPIPPRPLTPLQLAKQVAFDRIMVVEGAVGDGAMDVRDAHLELSAILRDFATQVTGVDARPMTLTELRASSLEQVAAVVATYYPIAFGISEHSQLGTAATDAKGVLSAWR